MEIILHLYEFVNMKSNKNLIQLVESNHSNKTLPQLQVGDTVRLGVSITEGNKERIQATEGVIISKSNCGINLTITIRRVLQGIGIERVYLLHSPKLKSIEILRKSKIRRAKLYYLRTRSGKATRLQQRFN
ncbi:ribosomal protein L19 (chloroplast) [Guillardia theta]|nr:ribosomal protein L19 [Guillardia theta]AAC35594.1 ribosomal protein L19 [Guillardia theta]